MFGYVIINRDALSEAEFTRFRAHYCGLCHQLYTQYGLSGCATLSYDLTFLQLLLASLYEPYLMRGETPCPAHPLSTRQFFQSDVTDYAADMNIALAYLNCLDDWQDELNAAALAGAKALKSSYERVCRDYPRQCGVIKECMARLKRIEDERVAAPDAAATAFGDLMAELFVMREDIWADTLRRFGRALGQFVYVMDACIDLKGDKRAYKYNPFVYLYGRLDEQQRFRDILQTLLADCIESFERLPMIQDADIIKNILCSGVWIKFNRHYDTGSK